MGFPRANCEDAPDYTADPDLYASDGIVGRDVLYEEAYTGESGVKKGYRQLSPLKTCDACGAAIITALLPDSTPVSLDAETATYVLYWQQRTKLPTVTLSRGYPAHHC